MSKFLGEAEKYNRTYRYIKIELFNFTELIVSEYYQDGHQSWAIRTNRKDSKIIGRIYYFDGWKKYIFESYNSIVWDESCLQNIIDFLKELNK